MPIIVVLAKAMKMGAEVVVDGASGAGA